MRRALVAALLVGCAAGSSARPLEVGEPARRAPVGLRWVRATGAPSLTYAAWIGRDRVVSVELVVDFRLVVRTLDPRGAITRRRSVRLGPAEWDVAALAVSDDGAIAYVGSADGSVRELELDRLRERRRFWLGDRVTALALSADGDHLITGTRGGAVCLRRRRDGALLQCVVAHHGLVAGLAARGDRIASASWDGSAAVFALPGLVELARVRGPGSANAVALAAGGHLLAIARSSAPPRRSPERAAAEARGTPADPGAVVELVDLDRGRRQRLVGHRGPVTAVAFTVDGGGLVSAGWDRTVRLWSVASGAERDRATGFVHLVRAIAVSPDGRWLVAGAWAPGGGPGTALLSLGYPISM